MWKRSASAVYRCSTGELLLPLLASAENFNSSACRLVLRCNSPALRDLASTRLPCAQSHDGVVQGALCIWKSSQRADRYKHGAFGPRREKLLVLLPVMHEKGILNVASSRAAVEACISTFPAPITACCREKNASYCRQCGSQSCPDYSETSCTRAGRALHQQVACGIGPNVICIQPRARSLPV